jgi:hypothetical protein
MRIFGAKSLVFSCKRPRLRRHLDPNSEYAAHYGKQMTMRENPNWNDVPTLTDNPIVALDLGIAS